MRDFWGQRNGLVVLAVLAAMPCSGFSAEEHPGNKTFGPAAIPRSVQEKEAERRKALPSVENKTLRVRSDLTVTGPGSIKGSRTSAAFRLWLEVENLTEQEVTLVKPTLAAADSRFVVTRWYLEKGSIRDLHG